MRLYQVTTPGLYQGNVVTWHGSKADVSKRVAEIKSERPYPSIDVQQHDIPTDKASLIDWLTEHQINP